MESVVVFLYSHFLFRVEKKSWTVHLKGDRHAYDRPAGVIWTQAASESDGNVGEKALKSGHSRVLLLIQPTSGSNSSAEIRRQNNLCAQIHRYTVEIVLVLAINQISRKINRKR
jgi:hypothetical protein